jgi:RNA polymerase sigma factor (sigma-70 family)
MLSYRFWIHNEDGNGRPLDENILRAAEEAAPTLARYRAHEIRCESTINAMLQSAVEAASKAKHDRAVDNPIGYLTFAYKRIVDRFLNRRRRLVPVDDTFLEDLVNASETNSFEERIHNRLLLEKLLDSMDVETRRICNLISQGYSMNEIAKQLHISANCLSKRYGRGLEKAIKKTFETDRDAQIHGKRKAG